MTIHSIEKNSCNLPEIKYLYVFLQTLITIFLKKLSLKYVSERTQFILVFWNRRWFSWIF